jgi:hypothetical protein
MDLVAGELFLDEMTNDWAVVWMILIFLVNNVVLMNLLIAIMSNTCKPPSTRSAVGVSRVHNGRRAQRQACATAGVHNGSACATPRTVPSRERGAGFRV